MGEFLRPGSKNSLSIVALLVCCAWAIGSPMWTHAESKATTDIALLRVSFLIRLAVFLPSDAAEP